MKLEEFYAIMDSIEINENGCKNYPLRKDANFYYQSTYVLLKFDMPCVVIISGFLV